MTRPEPDSGFLLLETLIAFVIAALALAVMFRAAFDGAAATAIAGHEAEALDRAQSRLAALRVMAPAHHYVHAGRDGAGFRYRESAVLLAARRGAALAPVRLTVTESWGKEQESSQRGVTLTTIIAAMQ